MVTAKRPGAYSAAQSMMSVAVALKSFSAKRSTKSWFFWATSAGSGAVSRVPSGLIDASWYVLPALSRSVMPITLSGTTLLSTCINAFRRLRGLLVKNKYVAKLKHLVYLYRDADLQKRYYNTH